jgi:hypothetical protein
MYGYKVAASFAKYIAETYFQNSNKRFYTFASF